MGFFQRRKYRKIGNSLLEAAEKVELYRRDLLSVEALSQQRAAAEALRKKLAEPFVLEQFEPALNQLHDVLVKNGGQIYPVSTGTDYTEMIIMAAIVAGGIRSFFLQPFKIPTNSMWPTYNGMTAEVRQPSEPIPNLVTQTAQVVQWTWTYAIPAEASGEVGIPINIRRYGDGSVEYSLRPKSRDVGTGLFGLGIMRSAVDKVEIVVGQDVQVVSVPADFGMDGVLLRTFYPDIARLPMRRQDQDRWHAVIQAAAKDNRIKNGPLGPMLLTGRSVNRGQLLLNFDIKTGDMLFVDRVSYYFRQPERGETFVFRTNNIPGLNDRFDNPSQNYFVKRLVGVPGDRLKVNEKGQLIINGQVGQTPEPLAMNNRQDVEHGYYGYLAENGGDRYAIPLTDEHLVTDQHYFAMGDNSANSFDSRGWGEVPAMDVVGRPLFILHPFTNHWGPAK